MRVLVAEDNADSRQLLEDILRVKGYTVSCVVDGQAALTAAMADPPDLLILDINMPVLNGFEVCTRLKENASTAQIPILMLTALADIDNRIKGLGLGADDYITKPFSPRELVARVDARMRQKVDSDQLRATQERIQRTFEQFVPPTVVQQLLDNPDQVRLGGSLQTVTVVFADLEGFTPVAEQVDPEHLLDMLNRYQELLVQHIHHEEGTIDKFLGDGLMALFNAPLHQPDHALRAIRAAVRIHKALPEFYSSVDPAFRLHVNFGITTGEAVVGRVGAVNRMNYTAIGDTVNLASRLEDLSNGGQILISESTYTQVSEHVIANNLGHKSVKGREMPVVVYEVVGLKA